MLVKTPYFGGVINKKNLSSLAYKLVNLLVFEENNYVKWARIEFFFQLYVWVSTLPMNLKSVLVYIVQ